MNKFEVTILGCGAALPTLQHKPTAQVVNIREKLFLIDCGEGTQLQYRKAKLSFAKLNHIFISHLHGDHCFGLIGFLSTLGLLGRTGDIVIHSEPRLAEILQPQIDFFCQGMSYTVKFESFDPEKFLPIYKDRSVTVYTIPLKHRVPSAGFLFQEAENELHLDAEAISFYNIPIKNRREIKQGSDFVTDGGETIKNNLLTKPAEPSRSYAFCSDTVYDESIVPYLENVDLLYHESTFIEKDKVRAKQTLHTTAKQAALIAKQANVKKLMLGHFSSRYNNESVHLSEAQDVFCNTILANELLVEKL